MKSPLEQDIIEAFNYTEIKVSPTPFALNISGTDNLFYSAVLTDKNNKDILVYIPVQDILDKKK